MHAAATSKVENSAQGSSCKLKFVHGGSEWSCRRWYQETRSKQVRLRCATFIKYVHKIDAKKSGYTLRDSWSLISHLRDKNRCFSSAIHYLSTGSFPKKARVNLLLKIAADFHRRKTHWIRDKKKSSWRRCCKTFYSCNSFCHWLLCNLIFTGKVGPL